MTRGMGPVFRPDVVGVPLAGERIVFTEFVLDSFIVAIFVGSEGHGIVKGNGRKFIKALRQAFLDFSLCDNG
jgi:hypothetical protein